MTVLRRVWTASTSPAGAMRRCWLNSAGLAAVMLCAAIVGVLGWTLHPRLLLLLPALAVLLVVGAVWPWLTILLVRGRLHLAQDRIHEGEEVHASLSLRQRAPWPAWGLLLDVDEVNCRVLEKARPFSVADTSFALAPQHRGTFPMYTPRLRTGFPFGLLTASRRVAVNHSLVVWPRIFPVAAPSDWASADMAVGHVETRRVGSAGDTLGVREYRRGDPMRWIHWPQTARHDRFMVREFQASGVPRVRIVLDCDSDVHVGQGSNSSFEWAVRIAASLAAGWIDEGAEVGLLAGSLRLSVHGGHRHRIRVLDALAEVQTKRVERTAHVPKSELTTVFISTDLGWQKRPEPPCCTWRGLMLRSQGFGGNRESAPASSGKVVAIERPDDVPTALLRVKRGLADVA
jgi:uncharacterized protein (DUF58 family)